MAENVFDVFNGDAFSMVALTDYVNRQPFVPHQMGDLNLFRASGIQTTSVEIDVYDGNLALIPSQPRGGPSNQNKHNKRSAKIIKVPHLPLKDRISADEARNVRAYGSVNLLQSAQDVVNQRLDEMLPKHDATREFQMIRAVQGTIVDADGSTVLLDIYNTFGVSQTTVDFDLGTAGTDQISKCETVLNDMEDALGSMTFDGVFAFCGRTWFQKFVSHPKVVDAYKYFQATGQNLNPLRDDTRYKGFQFGGIIFKVYRGQVGGIPFVAASEAYAFPLSPMLFRTYYAPSDSWEDINTVGLPRYAKTYMEDNSGRAMVVDTESNPISVPLRPEANIKLTTST